MKKSFLLLLTAGFLALSISPVGSQTSTVPTFIDYQGKVLDAAGNPLAPATPTNYEIQFRIYDAAAAGNLIWAEKQLATVLKGQFSVRLGEGQAILGAGAVREGSQAALADAFNGKERHLGLTVVIPGQPSVEIAPRLTFLSAPFALKAQLAELAATATNATMAANAVRATTATTADKLVQASGTTSDLIVGSVSYATVTQNSSSFTLPTDKRTVLVDAVNNFVVATLPSSDSLNKELLIYKKDASTNQVRITAPSGGTLNGTLNGSIYLKVKGESVTLQNVGANDWLVVNDARDNTPVGTVLASASGNTPPGYLACNGAQLVNTDYPELSASVGINWGGDGSSFRLPDLRGRFLRGRANGESTDPDRFSRTNLYSGGNSGDQVGSYQEDAMLRHTHGHNASPGSLSGNGLVRVTDGTEPKTTVDDSLNSTAGEIDSQKAVALQIDNAGTGNETRPENANVHYIIKY